MIALKLLSTTRLQHQIPLRASEPNRYVRGLTGLPLSPTAPRERLLAVDVFRGITVASMLLVNNPGSWGAIYAPLRHAPWHGWTPTDLIFPFFLFIVGITTHMAHTARRARGTSDSLLVRQIFTRGALIVLFGLLLNAFPFFPLERLTDLRFPGVLQRIGVCYIVAALLTLRTTLKQQIAIVAALLLAYWAAMTLIPVPGQPPITGRALLDEPSASLAAWVDRSVFGSHLWRSSKTWDPEGCSRLSRPSGPRCSASSPGAG